MTTRTTEATDRFVKVGDLNLHYLEWAMPGRRQSSWSMA